MRLTCQVVYLMGRRCQHRTHGNSEFCRWHEIINSFRQDLSRVKASRHYTAKMRQKTERSQRYLQISTGFSMVLSAIGFWMVIKTPDLIWLMITILGVGSACKYFADSIIALDYPLAQFSFWAKLLTVGMGLELVSGAVVAILLVTVPQFSEPITNIFVTQLVRQGIAVNPSFLPIGVGILATAVAILMARQLNIFTKRLLFWERPHIDRIAQMFPVLIAAGALATALAPLRSGNQEIDIIPFLEHILGGNIIVSMVIIGIAFFGAFWLAEIINVRMRAARLSIAGFKATIDVSLLACTAPPIIAIAVSRLLLFWLGIRGGSGYLFLLVLTMITSSVLCVLSTLWLIRREHRSKQGSPIQIETTKNKSAAKSKLPNSDDAMVANSLRSFSVPTDLNLDFYDKEIEAFVHEPKIGRTSKGTRKQRLINEANKLRERGFTVIPKGTRLNPNKNPPKTFEQETVDYWRNADYETVDFEDYIGLGAYTGQEFKTLAIDIDDPVAARESGLYDALTKAGITQWHGTFDDTDVRSGKEKGTIIFHYEGNDLYTTSAKFAKCNGFEILYGGKVVQFTGPHTDGTTYHYKGSTAELPKRVKHFLLKTLEKDK